jgi:hypothetical protein
LFEATAEYREGGDEIGEFISEMCFDYGRCDRALLYAAYKDWTGMGGMKFPLPSGFARAVSAMAGKLANRVFGRR